jgi:hypothetical protein
MQRVIDAPPGGVVAATVRVFTDLGVPIAVQDASAGLVTGAPTTVRGSWGTAMVNARVFCGKRWDSGVEYALDSPVEFVIGSLATPSGLGSDVRLTFNGSAKPSNILTGGQHDAQPCTLTASFASEVLARIAAAATAAPLNP